eukprot:TRINITY_DN9657_c0_g1_i1.p1 TRINITY_DN9657_c0_g1~~TRINITY_DN9657_c0_g1_i1.p1  ORF type:complete len:864 (-),score=125.24 TRINITY_DN9657_c0_g1_i1:240-2831(-)
MSSILLLPLRTAFVVVLIVVQVLFALYCLWAAYDIRLYPIKEYGRLIHEFDPWFNYRAAEYLAENGLYKFLHWYDYESWYPLGRPIGTTIYPGMQMTAVAIWEAMKALPSTTVKMSPALLSLRPVVSFLQGRGVMFLPEIPDSFAIGPMSVNDICCMMPCWFGSLATLFTGLLTYEISRSVNAGIVAAFVMALIPAHLMRSVGGEFDNEAVAMAAIVMTFWLWLLSVRTPKHWPIGVFAGLSYIYMVAAWGGYIFVLNMIGIHALMLVGLGRFNSGVHKAYSLFFIIGTAGAMQIPVVGWTPLRSLEQMGPLLVFLGYQVMAFCDSQRRRKKMETWDFVTFRIKVMILFLCALVAVGFLLAPTGYFGPLSSRIRGLFVKHTKTGNPLVDSVAEHQPANTGMYSSYLHLPLGYALYGGLVSLGKRNNGFYFLILYAFIAEHFSGKMSRLVLICAPIVSIACAIWFGFLLDQLIKPFLLLLGQKGSDLPEKKSAASDSDKSKNKNSKKAASASADVEVDWTLEEWEEDVRPGGAMLIIRHAWSHFLGSKDNLTWWQEQRALMDSSTPYILARCTFSLSVIAWVMLLSGFPESISAYAIHCDRVAQSLSNPQIVYKAQLQSGEPVLVDDYLKGYQWVDENTPKDARVMAWWDYGYQITGIAKRTSIADGNTWNHEHIATLGKTLTSPERKAWNAIRHLADYVLVWAGGGGDDLAKSPHLARIGNSVFPEHCGDDDPKCNKFSFYQDGRPTPMMAKSLLYKLVQNGEGDVKVNPKLFQEVHTTRFGLMRVYKVLNISQESKDWVADPKNRICDAPGSWYCVGQYPPALSELIAKRKNFAQLEDFNKKGEGGKSAYSKLIEQERGGEL